jgi:hypothetical protein
MVCENCDKPVAADEAAAGYQRCDECDPDGDHWAPELPDGGHGPCHRCHPAQESRTYQDDDGEPYTVEPAGEGNWRESPQGIADQIAAENHEPIVEPQWSDEEDALFDRMQAGETVVVSLRGQHANLIAWAETQDLYVRIDRRTEWGNPFEIPGDGDRVVVIANFAEHYLTHKPSLLSRVGELRGKALGCWCAPEPCHGDVLKRAAERC